jgi:hypothetical protein
LAPSMFTSRRRTEQSVERADEKTRSRAAWALGALTTVRPCPRYACARRQISSCSQAGRMGPRRNRRFRRRRAAGARARRQPGRPGTGSLGPWRHRRLQGRPGLVALKDNSVGVRRQAAWAIGAIGSRFKGFKVQGSGSRFTDRGHHFRLQAGFGIQERRCCRCFRT